MPARPTSQPLHPRGLVNAQVVDDDPQDIPQQGVEMVGSDGCAGWRGPCRQGRRECLGSALPPAGQVAAQHGQRDLDDVRHLCVAGPRLSQPPYVCHEPLQHRDVRTHLLHAVGEPQDWGAGRGSGHANPSCPDLSVHTIIQSTHKLWGSPIWSAPNLGNPQPLRAQTGPHYPQWVSLEPVQVEYNPGQLPQPRPTYWPAPGATWWCTLSRHYTRSAEAPGTPPAWPLLGRPGTRPGLAEAWKTRLCLAPTPPLPCPGSQSLPPQKCLSPGHFGAEMPFTGGHPCGRFPGFPECPFALPVILALPAALPSAPSMPGSCGPPEFLRAPCQPRTTWHPGRQTPVPTWPPTSGLHFLHWPSSERPHVAILRNCILKTLTISRLFIHPHLLLCPPLPGPPRYPPQPQTMAVSPYFST